MFAPPPPSRFQTGANAWTAGVAGGPLQHSILETTNTISHPSGPEYEFTAGEGTYHLREDIYLATPPPHPSEAPITNVNPLSTAQQPLTVGTKVSLVHIKPKNTPSRLYRHPGPSSETNETGAGGSRTSGETDESSTGKDAASSQAGSRNDDLSSPMVEKFGGANLSLTASSGKGPKKPKNNITKSNSSFVSRIITHEHLAKRLAERNAENLLVFANVNRAFNWLDMGVTNKQEPLSKILFTKSHPLCHDVNILTRSTTNLDVIIGFSTGDIIWFDPISNKYARINKNGLINPSAVTAIRFLPGSESLFLAAHTDGCLVVYNKDRDDAAFPLPPHPPRTAASFAVNKSVGSANQKSNPVSHYTLSTASLTAFAFSPDREHVAVVSEDGCLRILSLPNEKLLDVYTAYYGGLTCVCWSPDGRYIVTGGQDDLVSIWSFAERRIVARCEGHHSWVTDVAFDPWRCDDTTYRFGSVGSDCRLLLWDFSVGMLHRPKALAHAHRASISSAATAQVHARSVRSLSGAEEVGCMVHPVETRARTAVLPPVMSKEVDPDPLTQLVFLEEGVMTTCVIGHVRTWDRPGVRG